MLERVEILYGGKVLSGALAACEATPPPEGEVRSKAAAVIAGEAAPLCFRVASVRFLFEREAYDALPVV